MSGFEKSSEVDRILADYMVRVDRGEQVDPEQLIEQHPQAEEALREYFSNLNAMDGPATRTAERQGDSDSTQQWISLAADLRRQVTDWADRGLFSMGAVRRTLSKACEAAAGRDLDGVLQLLAEDGLLTPFQADALRRGDVERLTLGNYVLLDRLGAGGMGEVFKARHRIMHRVVALKLLSSELIDSEETLRRFRREVRTAASLEHPHVVGAYDADEFEGRRILVMQYVEGRNLHDVIARDGRLPVEDAADYVRQAALGMQYAHDAGVIHRDLKPHNLILDDTGVVRVLDVGIARLLVREEANEDDSLLTQASEFLGTVEYTSPEQAEDARTADERSDVYSLGCTLYQLLTGRSPFAGMNQVQQLVAHSRSIVPSARDLRPDVPAALDGVVRKMTNKSPAARYQTMADVAAALEPFSGDRQPERDARATSGQETQNAAADNTSRRESVAPREKTPARLATLRRPGTLAAIGLLLATIAYAGWRNLFATSPPDPTLLGAGGVSRTVEARADAERAAMMHDLLDGVKQVACPTAIAGGMTSEGPLRPILVGGPDAYWSYRGENRRPAVLAVAGSYGGGRVLAMSHGGVLQGQDGLYDNRRFAANALAWLDRGASKRIGVRKNSSTGYLRGFMGFAAEEEIGYSVERVAASGELLEEELDGLGLLVCANQSEPLSEREVQTVVRFVEDGGGLILIAVPWSYFQSRDVPVGEFPMNRLGANFGIQYDVGYLLDPTSNTGKESRPIFVPAAVESKE